MLGLLPCTSEAMQGSLVTVLIVINQNVIVIILKLRFLAHRDAVEWQQFNFFTAHETLVTVHSAINQTAFGIDLKLRLLAQTDLEW